MQYHLRHTTTYEYADAVAVCKNLVHLTPRETASQTHQNFQLTVLPEPDFLTEKPDYFGNRRHFFAINSVHYALTITCESDVDVLPRVLPELSRSKPWDKVVTDLAADRSPDGLMAFLFSLPSARIGSSKQLAQYARPSFPPGRPLLEAVRELVHRINTDFEFDPRATNVHTPVTEVLRLRRGVCQDFAHLAIGCLRSLGLPARYVSGYVRTHPPEGQPRLVGADASHAWLSVTDGVGGWHDFDPTNDSMPTDEHITVAWGRDYADVCPIQGVFTGGGQHTLSVAVDVIPAEELQDATPRLPAQSQQQNQTISAVGQQQSQQEQSQQQGQQQSQTPRILPQPRQPQPRGQQAEEKKPGYFQPPPEIPWDV